MWYVDVEEADVEDGDDDQCEEIDVAANKTSMNVEVLGPCIWGLPDRLRSTHTSYIQNMYTADLLICYCQWLERLRQPHVIHCGISILSR